MLRRPVVPDADCVRRPPEPDLIFRHLDAVEKGSEQAVAILVAHAQNARRKSVIDVQYLLAGLRVRADDRVPHRRKITRKLGALLLGDAPAKTADDVVLGVEILDPLLDRDRQALV